MQPRRNWICKRISQNPSYVGQKQAAYGNGRRLAVVAKAKPGNLPSHLSIDVEFAHYKIPAATYQQFHHPAEVCIVDWNGDTVYHSYCKHKADKSMKSCQWNGGVPASCIMNASRLQVVAAEVANQIKGCIVVGHGLHNDLLRLGVSHPKELMRDTSRCRPFQMCGDAQSLKYLVKKHLGLEIQVGRTLHSAREDAEVTMKLYRHLVENDPAEAASTAEKVMICSYLVENTIERCEGAQLSRRQRRAEHQLMERVGNCISQLEI